MHAYTQRIFQEKFLIDVAKDEKKKTKNKNKKCTKDMTLHVLVSKVLKLNTQPLRNDFLGQKSSLSIQAVYSPCFSHGFPDCSAKLNRPPLIESMEPRFSLQKLLGMSRPTDVCSRIQPF